MDALPQVLEQVWESSQKKDRVEYGRAIWTWKKLRVMVHVRCKKRHQMHR